MLPHHSDLLNTNYFFSRVSHWLPLAELGLGNNHILSQKRLADFSTGRYCAMKALEKLGVHGVLIPTGKHREPLWPEGIVGSISHCDSLTGAIVAKRSDYVSLGFDIEEIGRVTTDLWDLVFTENEKLFLHSALDVERRILSALFFSAKEAFYKFEYPITGLYLDFLDVELSYRKESIELQVLKEGFDDNLGKLHLKIAFDIHGNNIITVAF